MEINWEIKSFQELNTTELYQIVQLRIDIFMLEQNCFYRDLDNKDFPSNHLMGWHQDTLVAYARLLPPSISYEECSIGRVLVHRDFRKFGLGKQLMLQAIAFLSPPSTPQPIRISAQLYLQRFYEDLGFVPTGDEYLEDDIPHIQMLRPS
ncbi:MAG: GNAT family N-acetyltransferase [Sphingobacterium sp.]|uniref:GNAT family N-acetyltransferase n=1 Tax=Sphingobacterium sp. JB170 TaxID=1434842 RepID=UPI00097EB6FF|nr:GNAT family N-acetyltransferase [Sphingobacterium sp. JB170]SJN39245.1 ElaA protein [Sphingobacterium sp. JB170]